MSVITNEERDTWDLWLLLLILLLNTNTTEKDIANFSNSIDFKIKVNRLKNAATQISDALT